MFNPREETGYHEALPGIRQKTLVYGDKTLMVEFVLGKGSALPLHAHPYEQTGYLVKGHIMLTIAGQEHVTRAGDSWCIAAGAGHGAQAVEDSIAVEVFSPVREDYLPKEPSR